MVLGWERRVNRRYLMSLIPWYSLAIIATFFMPAPLPAQTADDSLKIYAVSIVRTPPFEKQVTGDGIYLGRGLVITAAHVVGRWPFFTHPRVLIAGQDLRAKVIKEGSFQETDLALLSVEETRLPISLRLRRNPLCNEVPRIGMETINVDPTTTNRVKIISPLTISPEFRARLDSLISSPEGSGSGLFDAERKCLVGIVSAKLQKYRYQAMNGRILPIADGYAGYFVSASKISNFVPAGMRF